MSADRTAEKVGWVREAAGARFDAIELNMLANELIVTDDRRGATRESLTRRKLPADEASVDRWLDSPPIFIGSVNEIVDLMQMRRERYGISYISMFEPMEPFMPVVKRLAGQWGPPFSEMQHPPPLPMPGRGMLLFGKDSTYQAGVGRPSTTRNSPASRVSRSSRFLATRNNLSLFSFSKCLQRW